MIVIFNTLFSFSNPTPPGHFENFSVPDTNQYTCYLKLANEFNTPEDISEFTGWLYHNRIEGVSLNMGIFLLFTTEDAAMKVLQEYPYVVEGPHDEAEST